MITEYEELIRRLIRRGTIKHYKTKVDASGEDLDFYNFTTNVDELVRIWRSAPIPDDYIKERAKYMVETVNYAELYTGEKIREYDLPQNVVAPIVR